LKNGAKNRQQKDQFQMNELDNRSNVVLPNQMKDSHPMNDYQREMNGKKQGKEVTNNFCLFSY
jgi:hypothetical protein